MADRPIARSQAHRGVGTESVTRVGILTGSDGTLGTASLLLEVAGLATVEADSLPALLALVREGSVAAVVVDPELGEGWPVDTAEQIAANVSDVVPVLLVCRHLHDAQIIQQRVHGPGVDVLLHDHLNVDDLSSIITGAIAAHLVRRKVGGPS